eukprot:691494-Prorocentrum_minimum.AAC.1
MELNRAALKCLADEGFEPEKTLFGNSTCPDEVSELAHSLARQKRIQQGLPPLGGRPLGVSASLAMPLMVCLSH